MDPTLESEETGNKETIFNVSETSGGMVNSVNGNLTMGDYIGGDQFHINIYLTPTVVATEGYHEYHRGIYPTRPPPNEADTNIYTNVAPSHGVRQPQHPGAFKPFTDYIDANVVVQACYPPGSADRALVEIQVITDIMDALMESSSLRHSVKLPETLASLQRILKLTKLAIRLYQDTPLAQTLGLAIIIEAEHCRQLLKKLLSSLVNCRHTLSAAMLHFIREYIWSRTGECNVSNDLDSKLRDCHGSFAACVLALGSFALYELEWGTGTGNLAELHNFSLLFKQESTSLQHIRIDTVIVVDHLARQLPIPIVFCKSWQDFHVVITGFCTDSAGVINRLHFSTVLQPGMTVEMSVVLHERAERYGSEEHRCPRCNRINSKVITSSGWVSW
ncbi:hypothetical protein FIBSPDRAFT_355117 [Athelia psychrophila]|uniref:Ubiquitin-like domain-containing protein n=1 Tax=Athelia psychrophila TaxID=1759441 RepID=A0A167VUG6_9AGAM|nr:hypothetical protein FIBSPDRAFT_355117 [Fibularhizoctonia sp. CBS 109695]